MPGFNKLSERQNWDKTLRINCKIKMEKKPSSASNLEGTVWKALLKVTLRCSIALF